jgi:hypothetical protein
LRRLLATLQRAELILKLAIAVLQFLVLAGQCAELVLQPLDADFRIEIGLREGGRRQHESACDERGAKGGMKSG